MEKETHFIKVVEDYLYQNDWRVKENSTVIYSIGGLILHNSGTISAHYWLDNVYDEEISNAHKSGDFHIHDLIMVAPYCAGWSIEQLIREGLNGVEGKVASAPAKHLSTLVNQMVNFLGILQNEWAGAQAFSSFDTYLAPFVRVDNLKYKEVKQSIQSFLFGVNTPSRWGSQPPFTNITLDWVVPSRLKDRKAIVGGKEMDFTYGDLQKEMDMINKALLECYLEGDYNGRGFQYPIPTYNITKDFDWDNKNVKLLFEMTSKYGTPYFQNFINSDLNPDDVRSMCLLETEKIVIKKNNIIKTIEIRELENEIENLVFDKEGWADVDKSNNIQALSLNPETYKTEWIDIKRILKIQDNSLIKIKTEDGKTMLVSKNHLVAIYEDNKIKTKFAKDLTENEMLITLKNSKEFFDKNKLWNEEYKEMENRDFAVVKIEEIVKTISNRKKYNFYDIELEKNHFFIHSQGQITHNCCRLQLDKRELRRRGGGLFGSDEYTGSIGVVTIDLPRIAYVSNDEKEFFEKLEKLMDIAKRSLIIKRGVIETLNERNFFPYTKRYLKDFNNHFSTIGLVGMNEATLNAKWIEKPLYDKNAHQFANRVLTFMRNKLADFQEETNVLFNLEASPAESAAYRLAKIDKRKFVNIKTAGTEDNPYYTNSSHLPVDFTEDIFSALDLQESLQQKYTGGTVFHTFLGEKIWDWKITRDLVKKIAVNYRIPYYTISPTYSICSEHGYITGEHFYCPKCGRETEVFSRITGYYRPVKAWNDGKQQEFKDRLEYDVDKTNFENKKDEIENTSVKPVDNIMFLKVG